MRTFKDQLKREIRIPDVPERLISLVPSQTELLVDLGLEGRLEGITKFCVHPAHLRKEKEVVGGTKQVKLEKIRALKPDLILCNKEENTQEMVRELEQIAPVHVSDVRTVEDSLELIQQYGAIFGVEEKAVEIMEAIQEELKEFQDYMMSKASRKTAYFIWKNPWMLAGGDTFIDHLLDLNKFENVFRQEPSRYPRIELQELEKREVEVILLSTEPYPFKEEDRHYLQDGFEGTQVFIVDGEAFSWYGSRLRSAFRYFREFQRLHFLS